MCIRRSRTHSYSGILSQPWSRVLLLPDIEWNRSFLPAVYGDVKRVLAKLIQFDLLDVENDVLDAARVLAVARGVSVGAALSELARRGVAARTPLSARNGFPMFQVPVGTPGFGPEEVTATTSREDLEAARKFLEPGR